MPLSDKEQQILQEIEKHLKEQDPEFARGVATSLETRAIKNLRIGVLLFVLGFLSLFVFFVTQAVIVGALAFVVMLLGATLALHNTRRLSADQIRSIRQAASVKKVFGSVDKRFKDFRRRDRD